MVTLAEVARHAQVTAATVSNVLRNPQKVKPSTVERVMVAIRELGYRPNLTARALAEGRTPTLALMLSNISNPFYPEFVLAAEREARKRGYFLLVCNTDDDSAITRAYLGQVAGTLAAGVLVMNTDLAERELGEVSKKGVPVVLCMWEQVRASLALPCVTVDFAAAGALAAEHLFALGHRKIGVLVGEGSGGPQSVRLGGFGQALAARARNLAPAAVEHAHDSIEGGYEAAAAMLRSRPALTAIFATNDLMAIGAMQAAADMGRRVPDDLSVMGLTDIPLARQFRPALTTVRFPTAQIAARSIVLAIDMLNGEQPLHSIFAVPSPELVVRGSTGAAPRKRAHG
ncbi:LacI family DNA-binding transcriptional regulator [Trinickia caryophylli]|uniref:Transcriptional regulator, LacI family n=1 Tax=Trinickia caryophylli TaxID=28094 RepID=A0A1X7D805_TRICW|nr:LacI family DNA-binding transcriptional regulator [Trinickia caryophylli]PMS12648.1 LacI family transcriptional regulator [Trinickia caryophylli]TRX15054.1 LacI family transcriptional regulator [Trinickia caryophylli]WQE14913.1 LacI family DNA-binding transcriptional regulator [Trinickia caryophylli]SMF10220.1 transcriptional regulator, LacI family [Trinickia caryophylli]GLU31361.1 LacI family transcriptional regulator [Trinickia caryophylli]